MDRLRDKLVESPLPEISGKLNAVLLGIVILLAGAALPIVIAPSDESGLSPILKDALLRHWPFVTIAFVAWLIVCILAWWAKRHRIDQRLLDAAIVKRSGELKIGVGRHGGDVLIPEYNEQVYQPRDVEAQARAALDEHHAVILRGRSQTGKTRIAANILLDDPRAIVIQPTQSTPPAFSSRGLSSKQVFLFLDDLHYRVGQVDAQLWWDQLRAVCNGRARLIVTTWPEDDWDRVTRAMPAFVRTVGDRCIIDASPFSREEGLQLYANLDLIEDFENVWDGTPGGIVIGLKAYHTFYEQLWDDDKRGVRGSWLLQAAKVLTDALQPLPLRESTLRRVVETTIASKPLSNDQWEDLKERTREKGFGTFENELFVTYSSYVTGSSVVDYEPPLSDFLALEPLIVEEADWVSLLFYADAARRGREQLELAERIYERTISIAGGNNPITLGSYAIFLTDIRKDHDRAEAFYERAIEADPTHAINLGNYAIFLKTIRQDHDRAEAFYERAIEADPDHANILGSYANFLTTIRQDHDRAEALYERAIEADPTHAHNLGNYAIFLRGVRKDYDRAQEMYERARRRPDACQQSR